MSHTHRHGEELRRLDEAHTRNAGKLRRCTGMIRYQDGQEYSVRLLFVDIHEALRVADQWRAIAPERRTVEFYEAWA